MNADLRAPEAFAGWPPPALDPAGPFAATVNTLSWVLFAGGGAVLALVVVALALALLGPRRWRRRLGGTWLVWTGGLAFPVVVLSALLIYGLSLNSRLSETPRPGEMRVRVTGEMWWWRVAYLDSQGREALQDANEVHIPVGRPVVFELDSADVIHSFWVPRLGGKKDMIPGRRNILRLQADAPGVYAGQCAEFCGGPHALMGFVVVAHDPAAFEAWRAARAGGAKAPEDPQALRGAEVFAAAGCGACHTVRGAGANGLAGPDLTHVGARRTLGAGILPNNRGTLAGWVADSQAIKPGNRMPSYPVLTGQDLNALAAYLEGLK
ncbi:cytochrome C oxidase subunit II [Phenylobacterium sp. Root77]|jgi:cytochrome c oxidase subunit 2|uniref:cytochrome c oxidase subunit II n=1 Tax=unclassified Phenylobacterium TaxID=2640670 RepID=UPI0006F44A2A|nr:MULTISPECIES: cytochrome c oxidase subunit II [unclassified Phenylobacterium]KQW66932.1 cytochrome C oxidase subunit II [Phenylobacterium sp. Root1277]KQW89626.1 cytochrome C oxidase subunit II [Phenylobacterium sp. Root1290]KRC43505.1 cytochrome C oxidase subunit II [Phenylobacterium sp. Root77]